MAATEKAAQEIRRFLDQHQDGTALNAISTIDDLNYLIKECGSCLSGALIPLEQAQRPQKSWLNPVIRKQALPGERCSVWRTAGASDDLQSG